MNKLLAVALAVLVVLLSGCHRKPEAVVSVAESKEAKAMLQGIWVDNITEDVVFKVKGDTVFYPDTTSLPAYFKIVADTLIMGTAPDKYPIIKQAAHLFWFKNTNGDIVKLSKSDDPNDALAFVHKKAEVLTVTEKLKKDTVVMYNGERYHCYIAINPTTYKVIKTTYTDDGVKVDNVYYDNIIHISIYKGADQLYSRDFNKSMYADLVPEHFLKQAVLSNMEYNKVDSRGFHFNAIVCIPDGDSCYMLDTKIAFGGDMSMELIEY